MPEIIILGTADSVPDAHHNNTHMAVTGRAGSVLIDCSGTPTVQLERAGIGLSDISDLILTHFHPDHVGGVPMLLMNMWLTGRTRPLRIYGLHHCLERCEHMMGFYNWENWPDFFQVSFHRLPERERRPVLEKEDFRILSSPVRHVIPTLGLRIESKTSERVVTYSCDTEPCPNVVRLAGGADVLIHEAAGAIVGHSSASQAGAIAREAGVEALFLIHYPTRGDRYESLRSQAQETFSGRVEIAEDFMTIDL